MILALRTDKPEAELYLYDANACMAKELWQAHRELSDTLLTKIDILLLTAQKALKDVSGIVVFQGPGSFTGLRIGITVANTLAYSLHIPIVASKGDNWLQDGLLQLSRQDDPRVVVPEYGSPARITLPRK